MAAPAFCPESSGTSPLPAQHEPLLHLVRAPDAGAQGER